MKNLKIVLAAVFLSCLFSCVNEDYVQKQITENNEKVIKSEVERIKKLMVDSGKITTAEIQTRHKSLQDKIEKVESEIKQIQENFLITEKSLIQKIDKLRLEQNAQQKVLKESFNSKLELYRKAIAGQSQALNQALKSFEEENKKNMAKNASTVSALETFLRRTVTEWQNQSSQIQKDVKSLNDADKRLDSISTANSKSIGSLENLNSQSYKQTIELYNNQLKGLQKALKNMQQAGSFLEKNK